MACRRQGLPSSQPSGLCALHTMQNHIWCKVDFPTLPQILAEISMTERRKFALLFAATILAARKLNELDYDRPSPAKFTAVDRAIDRAKFILDRIDQRWPSEPRSV
jgi:hypothetical protein